MNKKQNEPRLTTESYPLVPPQAQKTETKTYPLVPPKTTTTTTTTSKPTEKK